ncbi:MAG TPA: UDP-glucose 4-epimerase GalE [Candidatus Saccharimonadales bacterium]|nr:UDP-glucose 4-epimerase GalE [Candidatus Saccharimonadales bacterium]
MFQKAGMKNILVTGGAGFIGSHTFVELGANNYKPVIVDNFSNSDKSVLSGLRKITGQDPICYEGEFQDADLLAKIIKNEKIDGVIHFAAYKAVGESVEQPLKYYKNNIAGLVALLETLEKHKVSNFVFSSSCTVYGEADKLPLTESSPVKPAASPYGSTKQMGEIIIRDASAASQSLRSVSLRYFNPIGAHSSALIGELPRGVPSILVPFITQTVAGWRERLTVFGDDYPTPDGTCIRDYIHVVDLARAHVKALQYLGTQRPATYDVFNIGTGKGNSVLEVIKTFQAVTGRQVPYEIGPRRPGDIITSYADVSKAKRVLGWQAEKSLDDALADAWRWQKTLKNKERNES